jgi:hypothetical protein
LGTKAEVKLSGSNTISASIGENGCTATAESEGAIEACGKILYNGVCVEGSVNTGLSCTQELKCTLPPEWSCDPTTECCSATLGGGLKVSRTWEIEKSFGPASCEFYLKAGIGGSGNIKEEEGPGCECPGKSVTVQADLFGSGGGKCKAGVFGYNIKVSGDVTAGACGGKTFAFGCANGDKWISGAYVTVKIGPVDVGWFYTFEWKKTWKAGDGC